MDEQLSLPLLAPTEPDPDRLVPARMVNEWVYCPRLAYLEWVEGSWAGSADTEEGKRVHARVDAGGGSLPAPEAAEDAPPFVARAFELASERLGLIAKMDVVEGEDGCVRPVDTKKGKRPHTENGAYEPERVQLCVQALVLEDNGYRVGEGFLWFAGSRERVAVVFDDDLRARTQEAASALRLAAAARRIPPPLDDSRKCVRCSLLPVCLPDEINLFRAGSVPRTPPPSADAALPLYVQKPGARVGKKGDVLVISAEGEADREVPVGEVSELVLAGPVTLSTPALHACVREGVAVAWMSSGFWFLTSTGAHGPHSAEVREAQFALRADAFRRLGFARDLVAAKLRNQRTFLRRNWHGEEAEREAAALSLKRLIDKVPKAVGQPELLGLEGEGAAVYFRGLPRAFSEKAAAFPAFAFERRSRRPPADPVNACLSLCYALLTRVCANALEIAGLDPWAGLYHADRPGRPGLALDFMEPLRPILADSTVLTVLNKGELRACFRSWEGVGAFVWDGRDAAA